MKTDILELNSRYKPSEFQTENNSSSYALDMEQWNDRLKNLLAEKGWKVPQLAEAMGQKGDKALIERLHKYIPKEAGKTVSQPRGTMMDDMAKALGVSLQFLRDGDQAPPPPNATIGGPVPTSRARTPIYGQGAGGDDGRFVLNGQKVGEIFTPASLEGVANAYMVYVHGESMLERYQSGELVHVNPHRPVRQGDYVVIQVRTRDMDENETAGFVKRFVSRNEKEVVVEQFNPPKKLRFPRKDVVHIHKIVGSSEG